MKPKQNRYETEFLTLFDTMTQIVGYADNEESFQKSAQLIHDDLEEYHELYNIYEDYPGVNNIKMINDNAGIKPIVVNKKIIDLLLFAKEAYALTDGKVNVAFGSVLKIWHDHREDGIENPEDATLPTEEELETAARHVDIEDVVIDQEKSTVYLADAQMRLDVGAIAKGFATEAICENAEKYGFSSALISVGGNVRAIGEKANNGGVWKVGIRNPYDQNDGTLSLVGLDDQSLVTSGVYERYYTVNHKQYHHIINPETLFPADYFVSVSILCNDSGLADALSTALFNMSYEEGAKLIETIPDAEALWAFSDGSVSYSTHFKEFTTE